MPRATPIQVAFSGGEWRATLDGRLDLERYGAACRELRNFFPLVEGPAERRAGERFVAIPETPASRVTLIPFRFSADQAYVLELGELSMRFYTLSGLLIDPATLLPVKLVTPWNAEQARRLQYRQSADVMFFSGVGTSVPPQQLSRTSASAFTLAAYAPTWAPFRSENETESKTVIASANTGAITLTASGFSWTGADVGRLVKLRELVAAEQPQWAAGADVHNIDTGTGSNVNDLVHWEGNVYRLANKNGKTTTGTRPPIHTNTDGVTEIDGKWSWEFLHAGEGYARITTFSSAAVVQATVVHQLPDSCVAAATFRWAFGAWDLVSGYPTALEFFEERLIFGGTAADPDTCWGTRPGGAFDSFKPDSTALGAISFRMLSGEPNPIQGLAATKVLNVATSGGVFPVSGSDPTLAISIENLPARQRQVNYGAKAGVQPIVVDNVALFVQRSGRALREVLFDFDQDTFTAPDLGKLAAHLLTPGITGLAYAQEPYRMLLAWMEDGSLAGALYDRPQEALGWCRIALGGGDVAPVVEGVAVIPHPDGEVDQIWLAVKRSFQGTVSRSVGFLEKPFLEDSALEDAFFVDAGVSYDGAPVASVAGLSHAEGQVVSILADGARMADRVVSGGAVTLDAPASKVHVGFPFVSRLVPMRVEAGSDDGTAQSKVKRFSQAVLRLFLCGEGTYFGAAQPGSVLDELVVRDRFDLLSTAVPLVSGDSEPLPWPSGYERDGLLAVEHRGPTPCTVVAIIPRLVTAPR